VWQQGQSQGRSGGLGLYGEGTKKKDRPFGMACSQLKPTDMFGASGLVEPGQKGAKAIGLEALL
jgi:hypothetical protein